MAVHTRRWVLVRNLQSHIAETTNCGRQELLYHTQSIWLRIPHKELGRVLWGQEIRCLITHRQGCLGIPLCWSLGMITSRWEPQRYTNLQVSFFVGLFLRNCAPVPLVVVHRIRDVCYPYIDCTHEYLALTTKMTVR